MSQRKPIVKKGKKQDFINDGDEEDEFELDEPTEKSTKRRKKNDEDFMESGGGPTQIDISEDERRNLLSQIVRYMIFVDAKKQPIKREDLSKEIMSKGNYSKKRGLLDELLKEAAVHLEEIFGFELKEISASLPTDKITLDKKSTKPGNKIWILRQHNSSSAQDATHSNENVPTMNKIFTSEEDLSQMGFLFTVLAIIICNDQKVSEPAMWEYLRKHCKIQKDIIHPVLGNVSKLMEHFVKQMYLVHRKDKPVVNARVVNTTDVESTPYFYTIGPRAANEIMSKLNILEFLSSVTGNTISKSTRSRFLSEEAKQNPQAAASLTQQQVPMDEE